ncbi:MAG: aminotransferase class IV, partial [Nitrospinales bacterium]
PALPATIVALVQPLPVISPDKYRQGVGVSLFPFTAAKTGGLKERVKSCNFLANVVVREMALRQGSFEGIFLEGKNKVTEGTISNVFIVKDGVLKTPKPGPLVLRGVTRRVTLEIAREKKVSCSEGPLTRDDVYRADEVFITNSIIEILPVTRVDQRTIGRGKPGKITRALHRAFSRIVDGL